MRVEVRVCEIEVVSVDIESCAEKFIDNSVSATYLDNFSYWSWERKMEWDSQSLMEIYFQKT